MGSSVRTAAACAIGTLLVVTTAACTGDTGTRSPSHVATVTVDPSPALTGGASTTPEPVETDSSVETAPSDACPLTAADFAEVIGVDTVFLADNIDYGYPGDMMCNYRADRASWNVYVFPLDGISARFLRPGIESRFSDGTPFDAEGTKNGMTYDDGRSAIFDLGDVVVHVQGLEEVHAGVTIDLARAIASKR